jgi:hypothetical protein
VVCDDIEDEESVESADLRAQTIRWFFRVALPAMDVTRRIVMLANLVHPECLAMTVARDGAWTKRMYPIEYLGVDGERKSMWPSRYPLTWIDEQKNSYYASGRAHDWDQEFMLVADSEESRVFKPEHFRTEPVVRTWQAVYAMLDPARTVNAKSATTGVAVWSWIGGRMIVWECDGKFLKPDEIVNECFRIAETYQPVTVWIEEDGLNEWLMQPLRAEQVRRGQVIPIEATRAPKSKLDFIRGLYPFMEAREVIWSGLPEAFATARAQFLSFPRGRIDAPNALAYAPRLKLGETVYPDFAADNVFEGAEQDILRGRPCWLALGFDGRHCTGILAQDVPGQGGRFRVLADFVEEGAVNQSVRDVVRQASMTAPGRTRVVAGMQHFDRYRNLGLVQACKSIPVDVTPGSSIEAGRRELTGLLRERTRGFPAVMVSSHARWTLNGLSAGFARKVMPGGILAAEPNLGIYRTLIESLECLVGLMRLDGMDEEGPNERVYRTGRDGRPYVSALRGSA